MPLPPVLSSLRHRNFRLFFSGQLISLIGTWMDTVAEAWLVYRLSHSALLLGVAAFASQIPVFLLAPFGGVIADRFDRRKVVIWTQSLSGILAMVLAVLTLTHRVTIGQIIVLAVLLGLVNAVDMPTRQAFIVDMVSRDDMMNAIALNSSMFNGARVIGPAVAGVVVAAIGEGWCFFANSLSYIAVITGLALMDTKPRQRTAHQTSALAQVKEGFKFVVETRPIHVLMVLLGVVSLFGMSYSVLMPIFADQILHGGARALGILMGSAGTGALCGALVLASKREVKGLGTWITFAAAGFGLFVGLFAASRLMWLSCVLLLGAGFSMMVQMSASNTLIQSMVPDRLRGRVMAIYAMTFMGMAPIGALIAGTLAHHITAPYTVMIGGAACILAAIGFGLLLPSIRPIARQLIVAQQVEAAMPVAQTTGSIAIEQP
jgi:MFS family permease